MDTVTDNKDVQGIDIIDEMKSSFLDYSMSVIVQRALPDVRDGLKPVHRRILYAMHGMGNTYNKAYKKSARVIGEVLGKYHPHGDTAVYEALVRMAQDFSLRYTLVDGQGNFGSVDGDSAAAMRYTEVRMDKITSEVLEDIEKNTVDFIPNYDDSEVEPSVLPGKIPALLINGASGIAVGMATNIPPHNLRELVQAVLAYIDDMEISISDLIKYVSGPDFPTAGIISGKRGIYEAYKTGRGSIKIKARAEIETVKNKENIIITEIPYQVNKARLIEKIAELVKERKIEGISDLRDESDKDGIRIVIDVKKDTIAQVLLYNLYKQTALSTSFGINMIALVNNVPQIINLKDYVVEFVKHRREVVTRKTVFELNRAEEKAHIMEGLKRAIENLDEVISMIKEAENANAAKQSLIGRFDFSEKQATAILEMRLQRLTGLERDKIVQEYDDLIKLIAKLRGILSDVSQIYDIIKEELTKISDTYGDERHTEIVEAEEGDLEDLDLIEDQEVVIIRTLKGYIKRLPLDTYESQSRGGKGKQGVIIGEDDVVKDIFTTHTHADVLCFSTLGKVYSLKVYKIPEADRYSKGKAIVNLINIDSTVDERVAFIIPVNQYVEGEYVSILTKMGFIKKTNLMAFSNIRSSGIIGLTLGEGDEVISGMLVDDDSDIIFCSKGGKAIRVKSKDIRETGRSSRGVISMRFGGRDDGVVGMERLDQDDQNFLLVATENGYGKKTLLTEYPQQARGGQGVITIKTSPRNGKVVGMAKVTDKDDFFLLNKMGKVIRMRSNDVSSMGRNTQGVRLMNLQENDVVRSLSKIASGINSEETTDQTNSNQTDQINQKSENS